MRWLLLLVALLPTLHATSLFPWEKQDAGTEFGVTFDIELHGKRYTKLYNSIDKFEMFFGGITSKIVAGTAGTNDMYEAFSLIRKLDGLDTLHEGVRTHASGYWYGYANNLATTDRLTLGFTTQSASFVTPTIDLTSLFGYRITNHPSDWNWLTNYLFNTIGWGVPVTPAGVGLLERLLGVGYDPILAAALAALLEQQVDLNGFSGALMEDLILNSAQGVGTSLQSGNINPLKRNKSFLTTHRLMWQEFKIGYDIQTDWLSGGIDIKYIRGQYSRTTDLLNKYVVDGMQFIRSPIKDIRQTASLGFNLAFTPSHFLEDFALTIEGRNINSPTLKWKTRSIEFEPQYTLGTQWAVFSSNLPIRIGFGFDMNRVRDILIPKYHRQVVSGFLKFDPEYEGFGVGVNISFYKNVGDAKEPFIIGGAFAFKYADFSLTTSVHSSIQSIQLREFVIPNRFGGALAIAYKIKW